jgi:hypothetical protein
MTIFILYLKVLVNESYENEVLLYTKNRGIDKRHTTLPIANHVRNAL